MAEFWPESSEEIDLEDPKATAMRIVRRMRAVKELASKAKELEARLTSEVAKVEEKYRAELEAYKERVRELEEALRKYREVIDEQGKIIDDLATKTKKTIFYILYTLPLYLTEEDRPLHHMIVNKLKEIWCPEELAKTEQGRAGLTIPSAR
jgi:intergrase/recombinase